VRSSQNAQFQLLITKSKGLTKPGSQAHTNIGSKSLLADAFRKGPYFKFHNLLTSHHLKSVTWYLSSELDYHHDHFTMSVISLASKTTTFTSLVSFLIHAYVICTMWKVLYQTGVCSWTPRS
jgi:hypothetical protein